MVGWNSSIRCSISSTSPVSRWTANWRPPGESAQQQTLPVPFLFAIACSSGECLSMILGASALFSDVVVAHRRKLCHVTALISELRLRLRSIANLRLLWLRLHHPSCNVQFLHIINIIRLRQRAVPAGSLICLNNPSFILSCSSTDISQWPPL